MNPLCKITKTKATIALHFYSDQSAVSISLYVYGVTEFCYIDH